MPGVCAPRQTSTNQWQRGLQQPYALASSSQCKQQSLQWEPLSTYVSGDSDLCEPLCFNPYRHPTAPPAESLSTLKFANRAKSIRNLARVNEDVDQRTLLRKYERELRRLRAELQQRQRELVDKRHLLKVFSARASKCSNCLLECQAAVVPQVDKLAAFMSCVGRLPFVLTVEHSRRTVHR